MGWTSNWNKKTFAKPTYPKSLWISCMLWYPEVSHITWDVWSCSRVSGSLPWISQMDAKSWMEAPKCLVTQNPWIPCNVCYSFVETFSWEKVFATILLKKKQDPLNILGNICIVGKSCIIWRWDLLLYQQICLARGVWYTSMDDAPGWLGWSTRSTGTRGTTFQICGNFEMQWRSGIERPSTKKTTMLEWEYPLIFTDIGHYKKQLTVYNNNVSEETSWMKGSAMLWAVFELLERGTCLFSPQWRNACGNAFAAWICAKWAQLCSSQV